MGGGCGRARCLIILPEILFSYMSTFFFTGRGLDTDEYIFEVESMHTFHVHGFLFLSFAPGRDGPIRHFGRSELHGISFSIFLVGGGKNFGTFEDFWNMQRFYGTWSSQPCRNCFHEISGCLFVFLFRFLVFSSIQWCMDGRLSFLCENLLG